MTFTLLLWDELVEEGNIKDQAFCPHCQAQISKGTLDRAITTVMDDTLGKPISKARRKPVLIDYTFNGQRYQKSPDDDDLELLRKLEVTQVPGWYPTRRIDEDIDLWYERDYRGLGVFSVSAFFSRRNLIMASWFRDEICKVKGRLGGFLWFWFQSVLMGFSHLNRYRVKGYSQVNQLLSGTLYIGAVSAEISPWYALEGKIRRLHTFEVIRQPNAAVSTGSTAAFSLSDCSVDYIFVDPPFGSNIIYSDLSIIWESWLRVSTNTSSEAVVHRRKKQGAFTLDDYGRIMTGCFSKMYQVLKPGRWITVEFHNSKNSVWTAIQEALTRVGFVVADVRTLDKQMQTFKQVTAAGAVKQDLIISAYKPNSGLEERFKLEAGTVEGVWDFVRTHLKQLPVFVAKDGQAEIIAERQNYLIFDRMVAFHVQRGVTVPLSAAEFYQGLVQRFSEREDMYFLPEQVAEYDKRRMTVKEVLQLSIFVIDESSAIQWLKQQLVKKPQTFQEIHPQFLREIGGWQKHEKPLELSALLEENFLRYEGRGEVPSQIHSYLSTNFKELRNLPKDDPTLRAKARDRWYVPDPNKAGDLEKLRERTLLREFDEYRAVTQKRLKVLRLEAVRAGFKKAWGKRDYTTIIDVASKIPENVL